MSFWGNVATGLQVAGGFLNLFGGRSGQRQSKEIATYNWLQSTINTAEAVRQLNESADAARVEAANLDARAGVVDQTADVLDARAEQLFGRVDTLHTLNKNTRDRAYEAANDSFARTWAETAAANKRVQAKQGAAFDRVVATGRQNLARTAALEQANIKRVTGEGEARIELAGVETERAQMDAEARTKTIQARVDAAIGKAKNDVARINIETARAQGKLEADVAQSGVGASSFQQAREKEIARETGRQVGEQEAKVAIAEAQRNQANVELGSVVARGAARMGFTRKQAALATDFATTKGATNIEHQRVMASIAANYQGRVGRAEVAYTKSMSQAARDAAEGMHGRAMGAAADAFTRGGLQAEDVSFQAGQTLISGQGARGQADELRDAAAAAGVTADAFDRAATIGQGGLAIHPGVEEYGGDEGILERMQGDLATATGIELPQEAA